MSSGFFVGYVLLFGLAAVACFVSLGRLSRVQSPDVRAGLWGLLTTSGGWATAHVGYLLVPSESGKLAFYVAGLLVGFATVGAWLYFCSAYTGRTYHRQQPYRYLALAVFSIVVLLKLTNPIHSLYFTTEVVSSPFPYLAVSHGSIHWVVMALAYALAFVGFFMLFERFIAVGFDTTPLAVLVGFTALPVTANLLGLVSPVFLDITYEPIGVAVFAVGVLFVYIERFQAVNLAGETDVPVILLDDDYRVQGYNRRASELVPSLAGSYGTPLSHVSQQLADGISADEHVISDSSGAETRYYLVSVTPFTAGDIHIGYLLTLSDITETEQYRRELEQKTERLEQFASVVSHDLRNPLNVAKLRLDLAQAECNSTHLKEVNRALERMEALIDDLLALAREGQAIDEIQELNLATVAQGCWQGVDTVEAELVVESDRQMLGDATRLQQLLENLFRNAIEHGGEDVTITVGALGDGFYIADDGPGIPEEIREEVFEFGYSTTSGGTGFGLSIVKEITTGHGWDLSLTESVDGGARFEITNVDGKA